MTIPAGNRPESARRTSLAYRANLILAIVAASGLLLRLVLIVVHPDPAPDNPELLTRLVRFVSYFTIQSNLVVLLAALAVVQGRDLGTTFQRALRLAALVGISVTGIVYVTILAGADSHTGLSSVANALLHYICPPLAVLVWMGVGPWIGLRLPDLRRMLIWPVLWIAYTLIRGAIVDWYPYGFIDATLHSYGQVAVNVGAIVVFAVALGAAYAALDRWRAGGGGPGAAARPGAAA